MPAAGGESHQITKGPVSRKFPQWSLDGQWIYYASEGPNGRHLYRLPAAGGHEEQITKEAACLYFRWSPDRTRIYLPGNSRGNNDLWSLTPSNGKEKRMTRFSGRSGSLQPLSLAVGNTHLYRARKKASTYCLSANIAGAR